MSHVIGLKCRECSAEYPSAIQNTCFECFKKVILDSGGYAASPTDDQIIDAIFLLARTEGIFTEPAGCTTIAGLKILVEEGHIDPDERSVVYVTGNCLKARDTLIKHTGMLQAIQPTFGEFKKNYVQLLVT